MSPQELGRLVLLEKIKAKQITQKDAAQCLDLSTRQIIRLCQKHKQLGASGIVSKRR
jgi:hypothetical protein